MKQAKEISFKDAIREAFEEELSQNPRLFILGEDIVQSRKPVLAGLEKQFPKQVVNNLPLLEDMICGIGLGMSIGGLLPVIAFNYSNHLTLALDDIYRIGIWRYRMAEYQGPGVIVRLAQESLVGKGPDFSASLLALLFHIPNLWIATPSRPLQAKGLLKKSFRSSRPVIFWEHKNIYDKTGQIPVEDYTVPFGTSVLFKPGKDVTVISWSYMSYIAKSAAEKLESESIDVEVISLQTLKPMDMHAIFASIKKTMRAVVVEEDNLTGGIGAEIVSRILEKFPACRVQRLGAKDVALPGLFRFEKKIIPTEKDIIEACLKVVKK